MLPAYIANMMPVIAAKMPMLKEWSTPINSGRLGKNKTWRGLFSGIIGGIIAIFIQAALYDNFAGFELISYKELTPGRLACLGALFGAGALIGDAIKSLIKRRVGIPPGRPWIPFDQLDYTIGALIFTYPVIRPPITNILIILLISPFLTIAVNIAAFRLHLKKARW